MLQYEYHFTKYGETLIDVLHSKHPDATPLTRTSLESYIVQSTEIVPFKVTKDTVMEVAGSLSGGAIMGWGGIGEPTSLDHPIQGGKRVDTDDSGKIH